MVMIGTRVRLRESMWYTVSVTAVRALCVLRESLLLRCAIVGI